MADTSVAQPQKGPNESNRLIVADSTCDNSVATLSPSAMESNSFTRGDTIFVSGTKGRAVLVCLSSDEVEDGHIQMNQVARNNLSVEVGDSVTVNQCLDIKYGKEVHILPFEDSIEGFDGNLFDVYMKPYFLDAFRPVCKGDTFIVRGSTGPVEFKVMYTNPPEYCIVAPETVLYTDGDPVKRKKSSTDSVSNETAPSLVVEEATINDDNSMIYLHPSEMKARSLSQKDIVVVSGPAMRETVFICMSSEDVKEGHIQMNQVARNNLRIMIGELVTVHQCLDIKHGERVYILPFADTIEGLRGHNILKGLRPNLLKSHLIPYFKDANRPVRQGDTFLVHGDERTIEFKVVMTLLDVCIVGPDTIIETDGKPLKRNRAEYSGRLR